MTDTAAAVQVEIHNREVDTLTQSIRELNATMRELRTEIASTYVRKDVLEPRVSQIEKDVARHGSYFDWIVRLILGTITLSLLGLVIVQNVH